MTETTITIQQGGVVSGIEVPVICEKGVVLPVYERDGSSGMDLRAFMEEPITLRPQERSLISTGLTMAIPLGYEAQIRSRSGLALKHGIIVLNSPGTIDASYRGVVNVLLWNSSQEAFVIEPNMRMAQCVFAPVVHGVWKPSVSIAVDTDRGVGGFGSTGVQ